MLAITAEELRHLLDYDVWTGEFKWKVAASRRVKVGAVAGHVNCHKYRVIGINGVHYRAHRLAYLYVNGYFPSNEVDHINGVRDDNRWSNLREATGEENHRNQKLYRNNLSGVTGVSYNSHCDRWIAKICVGGKWSSLGGFKTLDEAASARKAAEERSGYHENHGKSASERKRYKTGLI